MSDGLLNKTTDCPQCGGNGVSDGGECQRCNGLGKLLVCCGYPPDHDCEHFCEEEGNPAVRRASHTIPERLRFLARGGDGPIKDASLMYAAELLEGGE